MLEFKLLYNMHCKGVVVVLLVLPLWLGWLLAAPPPPHLVVLRPIPLGVGVIVDFSFLFLDT